MISFSDFLSGSLDSLLEEILNHDNGTYIQAIASEKTQEELYDFVKKNKIENHIDPIEYHSTIIYSRKGIPKVKKYYFSTPIEATVKGWKFFDTKEGKKCLVLELDSSALKFYHEDIMKTYGATYDFEKYIPHLTVSYDYNSDKFPPKYDKKIIFDKVKVQGLDPTYIPKAKKEN